MTADAAADPRAPGVNNDIYHHLGERWHLADDDPVALLRAESRFRNPWIVERLSTAGCRSVLDVGCGGGFLSNELATHGFDVMGLDAADDALAVASRWDASGRASYVRGDALRLPFADGAFDAACAMDFLEHVEDPAAIVREMARVVRPGGLWFFHTFNRTRLAEWIAIRGVEAFIANTPRDLHVLRLFVTPDELRAAARGAGLTVDELFGTRPALDARGLADLARIAFTGRVPKAFRFTRTASLAIGYLGCGRRGV